MLNKLKASGNEMQKYLRFIPGAHNASAPIKWGITGILAALCIFLLIPVSSKPNKAVQRILEYSPVQQANEYYEKSGPKAAYDFIKFYESLPGAAQNHGLKSIKEKAAAQRSSWLYIGSELGRGALGLEHHEDYAKWAKTAVTLVPYGNDLQSANKYAAELVQEWQNYSAGKDVDMLHIGVATLGLVEVALGLLPGDNPMINKLKSQTNTLLDSIKIMNSNLRNMVENLLEPVFNSIEKSDLTKDPDSKALIAMIQDKKRQFEGILQQAEKGLNNFQGLVNLEKTHKDIVPVVVASSSNFKELDKNSAMAEEIAKLSPDVLLYGGTAALQAAERLKAEGKFNIRTLEEAMKYGAPGLDAVGIISLPKLEKEIARAKNPSNSEFRIPGILVFIVILASLLVLARTWLPLQKTN